MRQTTSRAPKKQNSVSADFLKHSMDVRPYHDHELPLTIGDHIYANGWDFSQLPLNAVESSDLRTNLNKSCPLFFQHWPFGVVSYPYSPKVQAKLTINKPGDKQEQEATGIAEQVMHMPGTHQEKNEQDQMGIKRVRSCLSTQAGVTCNEQKILRSPGQPLDPTTRAFMESRFSQDFTNVRIHTDSEAATLNNALKAHAFTVGNHIAFNRGILPSSTSTGMHLLAHELTHVVQQSNSNPVIARLSASDCSTDCAKEDGQGSATGKFSITVYADKEGAFLLLPLTHKVGHSWLRIEDDKGRYWTYGFWPQEGYGNIGKWGDKGCVYHPDTISINQQSPNDSNLLQPDLRRL